MPVDPHPAYLAAVQHAYEVLDDNFDELYQQCTTAEQRRLAEAIDEDG